MIGRYGLMVALQFIQISDRYVKPQFIQISDRYVLMNLISFTTSMKVFDARDCVYDEARAILQFGEANSNIQAGQSKRIRAVHNARTHRQGAAPQ